MAGFHDMPRNFMICLNWPNHEMAAFHDIPRNFMIWWILRSAADISTLCEQHLPTAGAGRNVCRDREVMFKYSQIESQVTAL
ncbi:hypothetical protein MSG28_012102 [Choristoneura fumiferana]|uniref:Uncharacterized protein n=1 Tax=Choristoneura fumiferana TaxID=7141 RepID=A0ACC0KBS7_CHOFU|nr:hypothetical protein MSG28_012102 [Choristoneura fumiferana]